MKNLESHDKGRTFKVIMDTLRNELGYKTVEHRVISSAPWVPQKRERIFIAGFRDESRFTFEKVRGQVERFLEMKRESGRTKPHTLMSIIVMDETANELEEFQRFWTACGADQVLFKPYVNWTGQEERFIDLATPGQRAVLSSPRPHPCKLMWDGVVIAWDGRVVPCCYDFDAKPVMGNLNTQTLDEIWNGPAHVELRRRELAGENNCELCRNCGQAPGHERDQNWDGGRLFSFPLVDVRKAG
mgnify:CR=1 FL=1